MNRLATHLTAIAVSAAMTAACGSSDDPFGDPSETTSSGTGATSSSGSGSGGDPSSGTGAATGAGGDNNTVGNGGGTTTSGSGGGAAMVNDPDLDGPFSTAVIDDQVNVPATGNTVAIHAVYPTGGPGPNDAGPYPVVLVAHGFQLPPTQYYSYLDRLATHGYVALTVDFVAGFINSNHVNATAELLAGIDWVAAQPELMAIADTNNVGATGHSLGGKLSVMAAAVDSRIQAIMTLDPVDGGMCNPQNCPDASALLPLSIPTGFIGETIDATGGFQSCAPAAENFMTFYGPASSPSIAIDVLGANHMSFLDDVSSCGFTCSFCNAAAVDNATVNALSRAFVVAFYERHLRGNVGYDAYLTGAEAQTRYVDTGLVTITAK